MAEAAAPAGGAAAASAAGTPAVKAGWRPVVTALLQRADGRVLVVQRSGAVGTYQGMWGGVSGGVEAGDTSLVERAYAEVRRRVCGGSLPQPARAPRSLQAGPEGKPAFHAGAAATQVEEEAGVPRARLRLACVGRPLPVRDGARRFLVHPFLFAVAGGDSSGGGSGGSSGGGSGGQAAGSSNSSQAGDGGGDGDGGGVDATAAASDPRVTLNWENTAARWVTPRRARAARPTAGDRWRQCSRRAEGAR